MKTHEPLALAFCFCMQSEMLLFYLAEGLQEVILYHQPDDKKKNRGFCFLEYEDHKSAAQARRRLMSGKVKVWGNPVTVEWADPVAEPDPEVMAKVRNFLFFVYCTWEHHSHIPDIVIPCFVCVGEGPLCQEAGHSRHWGAPWKDLLSIWKAGASKETKRLCFCPFWRERCCCKGGFVFFYDLKEILVCLMFMCISATDYFVLWRPWMRWMERS